MAIRILIADDADLTLLGARLVLEQDHRCQVVGAARGLGELLEQAERQHPDLIVFNEWFHQVDILTVVERLQHTAPDARLIAMGTLAGGLLIRDLLALGVKGYLHKSDDLQSCLPQAVQTVMRDRPYLSPTANSEYLVAMQSPGRDWQLDPQARSVLRLLAQGYHVGQIALALNIGPRRVYWLRHKLRRRFGAKTNEHLIQRAAAEGFIYPRD